MQRPPSSVVVDGEEEFKVEEILRYKGSGAQCLYQVLWKGYPISEASWEPKSHLCNAPHILEEYVRCVAAIDVPFAKRPSTGTVQQRLFSYLK